MKRSDAAAIGLLTLLAVAWAWPIAARISIAIPGSALDHDVATMVWNVGWVQQAIETRQSSSTPPTAYTGTSTLPTSAVTAP